MSAEWTVLAVAGAADDGRVDAGTWDLLLRQASSAGLLGRLAGGPGGRHRG